MEKEYIVFIDSGIGGLTTLSETIKILDFNYIYFADNKNIPYGNHSREEILIYLTTIINKLSLKYKFNIVVLACNTATTSAIESLKIKFPNLKFIGTEPAIKLAYNQNHKKTFCIATPTTIKQFKYKKLIDRFRDFIKVQSYAPKNLAYNIEEYLLNNNLNCKFNIIKDTYSILSRSKNSRSIILGCTHYVYLKNKFSFLSNKIILDGNVGIAKNIAKNVKELNLNQTNVGNKSFYNHITTNPKDKFGDILIKRSTVKIIFSKQIPSQRQKYIKILNQILAKKHFI